MLEKVQKHEKYEADLFASVPGSHPNKKKMQTHEYHCEQIPMIQKMSSRLEETLEVSSQNNLNTPSVQ